MEEPYCCTTIGSTRAEVIEGSAAPMIRASEAASAEFAALRCTPLSFGAVRGPADGKGRG